MERFAANDDIADFFYFQCEETLAQLKAGVPEVMEAAILLLEVDPFCYRSGYIKRRLCDALKKPRLDSAQEDRLRAAIIHAVNAAHPMREFKHFARLARRLYTSDFLCRVRTLPIGTAPVHAVRRELLLRQLMEAERFPK